MSEFSLWTEPWVPVQTLDGDPIKVSLPRALTEAHRFRGILDPSPLIPVALHRLLLALIYRTQALDHTAHWQALWQKGRFDARAIVAYGEQWADRFDLLHPTHPFYQVPFQPAEQVHPVAALALEAAAGINPALFDPGWVEGTADLPLDRAACYLLAHQLFAIGSWVARPSSRMDAPLTKGLVVEVIGRNLFETLALNAMPLDQWQQLALPTGEDRPFWEEERPAAPRKEGTVVRGPLHYLTWQSRRVNLMAGSDARTVTGCQIAQRYCLPRDGRRVDPGKSYVVDETKETGWLPRRLAKDRAAWRMTHLLLQPAEQRQSQPQVLSWLATLRRRAQIGGITLPGAISLAVTGMSTDPRFAAKGDLWRREEIGLPMAILDEPDLIRLLAGLMDTAGRVEAHLRRTAEALVGTLAEREHQDRVLDFLWTGKTGVGKMPPTMTQVARSLSVTLRYWAALEAPFRTALWQLAEGKSEAVRALWHDALKRNARAALDGALTTLQSSGAPWETLTKIEAAFDRRLTLLLAEEEATDADDSDAALGYPPPKPASAPRLQAVRQYIPGPTGPGRRKS